VDNALRLSAVDAQAAKLGLSPGMALADARAMIPALDVIAADEVADRKFLERIADWCERFSPLVALDPPHGLFFDVTGTTHLFGGERDARKRAPRDCGTGLSPFASRWRARPRLRARLRVMPMARSSSPEAMRKAWRLCRWQP
jgi:protein ImuB